MSELQTTIPDYGDEIDVRELIKTLWAGRLVLILCTAVVAAGSVSYALVATKIFRAQASVQIREQEGTPINDQLGSLAALAGIPMGSRDQHRQLALTALTSRVVIQRMIEEEKLLTILYADDWDSGNKRWLTSPPPTPWTAYELFTKEVLNVSADRNTGIVTISIDWEDPILAAAWVHQLITRVNAFVNEGTIREAEQNLAFLDRQAQSTPVVELQKTIFSMMESEIKRLMIARNPETAPLRVIDPAVVAEEHVSPRLGLLVALGFLLGGILGAVIVLIRSAMRS